MTPERWKQIDELVQAALERSPKDRAAFLDQACSGDEALRREVGSVISYDRRASDFLEQPAFGSAAEITADDRKQSLEGATLGRYRIERRIGAGGMGEVYLAKDGKLGRKAALKFLPSFYTKDKSRLHRFEQEARAASALNHPNIITIYEVGETDDQHFLATEFIDGQTLRERLKSPMNIPEALEVGIQVGAALVTAHQAGIIHRDIKPENIMLRRDGIVKVLDFGLAKLTERVPPDLVYPEAATRAKVETSPGVVMGTATYMSPEQARGLTVDERTDIWSLGVVLYEMVAGRLPFDGETASDVISMILHKEPPALTRLSDEATERLDEIVTKALAKNREERYQVAKDLLIDLRRLKQHLDFESEIERTSPPESRSATAQPASEMTAQPAAQSATISAAVSTRASSAEYIVTEIKRHKKGFTIVAASVMALAIIVAASYLWISSRRAHALTDKDTIVLADFVNTTGDAVFDGTIKQGLAVQLEQSPFLNIFPEERVRETLRLMSRSPDERVTKDIAREICQRQGLKAYLAGSISNLGSHLVITLEAVNVQTADTLARQQVEAESKEQVLSALGNAATKLREKLGESLASIQKYDAPIEQATTSSLEALKAYSLGRERHYKGNYSEAIPLIKRAIELDPNFARAYAGLAYSYGQLGQRQLAKEAMQKAFELRERASEHEKLKITADYYATVEGDREKSIEALGLVTRTYPRDYTAHGNLSGRYNAVGRYEQAIEEAREAVRLNPNYGPVYAQLAVAFRCLNRFDEAKEIYEQALAQKLDTTGNHTGLYSIAFVRGDTAAMQQQLDWARGKPNEYEAFFWQAGTAAFMGQLRRARDLSQRGADAELSRNLKENVADTISGNALTDL